MKSKRKTAMIITLMSVISILILWYLLKDKTAKTKYTATPYLPNYFSELIDWTVSSQGHVIMLGSGGEDGNTIYISVTDDKQDVSELFVVQEPTYHNNETIQAVEKMTVDADNNIYIIKREYEFIDGQRQYNPLCLIEKYSLQGELLGDSKSFDYVGNPIQSIHIKDETLYIHEMPKVGETSAGKTYIVDENGNTSLLDEACWGNIEPIDGKNMYYMTNNHLWHYNHVTKEKKMMFPLEIQGPTGLRYDQESKYIEIQGNNTILQYNQEGKQIKEVIGTEEFPDIPDEAGGRFYKNDNKDYFLTGNINKQIIYQISKIKEVSHLELNNSFERKEVPLEMLREGVWGNATGIDQQTLLGKSAQDGQTYTYKINKENLQWERRPEAYQDNVTQDLEGNVYELIWLGIENNDMSYEIKNKTPKWQITLDEDFMGEYTRFEYSNGYFILYTNTNTIEIRDHKANLISKYSGAQLAWTLKDTVYILSNGRLYKQLLGEELDESAAMFLKGVDYISGTLDEEAGNLYLCSSKGVIDMYDIDGQFKERLLDISHILTQENKYVIKQSNMIITQKEIYLLCMAYDGAEPVTYINQIILTEGEIGDKSLREDSLSYLVLDNTPMLSAAISLYKADFPYINLDIQRGNIQKASKEELNKFIQRTNTEILTGEGADILSLASLPYQQYIDKGVLSPLGTIENLETQYPFQVIKPYSRGEEVYGIPLGMQVPVMIVNEKVLKNMGITKDWEHYKLDQITEVASLIEPEHNVYIFPKGSMTYISYYMLTAYYDQKIYGQLDGRWEEGLVSLLNDLKELSKLEHPVYTEEDMLLNQRGEVDQVLLVPTVIFKYQSLEEGLAYKAMPVLEEEYYPIFALDIVGISGNVKNKEGAQAFIDYSLSEKIQKQLGRESFPIHQEARIQLRSEALNKKGEQQVKLQNIEEVDTIIDKVAGVFHNDQYAMMLREEGRTFIEGNEDIDKIVNRIKQQFWILKEE